MPLDKRLNWVIDRQLELVMALAFLGESVLLMFSPGSIRAGAFQLMLQIMDAGTIRDFYFLLGTMRIVALGLNGHWMPYGAYVRAVCAAFGAIMLAQMATALVLYSTQGGNILPFGIPFFAIPALCEVLSMYRALLGARSHGIRLEVDDRNDSGLAPGPGVIPFSVRDRVARHRVAGAKGL